MDTVASMIVDERFEVEWETDVMDSYNSRETKHVTGALILTADTIFSAMEYAEEVLCDVDFFFPGQEFSASSPCVLSGYVKIDGSSYKSLSTAWPSLVEADFERVDILGIRKL